MNLEEYRNVIMMAISREVESYVFYRSVSEKVTDKNLKSIFKDLAGDETKHRELLEGYLAKPASDLHFDSAKDYKLSKTIERPPITTDLKPIDGMKLAIKKEEDAMEMYTGLANASTDAAQKKIFLELAKMETGHKARLEDIFTNMAFPEVW